MDPSPAHGDPAHVPLPSAAPRGGARAEIRSDAPRALSHVSAILLAAAAVGGAAWLFGDARPRAPAQDAALPPAQVETAAPAEAPVPLPELSPIENRPTSPLLAQDGSDSGLPEPPTAYAPPAETAEAVPSEAARLTPEAASALFGRSIGGFTQWTNDHHSSPITTSAAGAGKASASPPRTSGETRSGVVAAPSNSIVATAVGLHPVPAPRTPIEPPRRIAPASPAAAPKAPAAFARNPPLSPLERPSVLHFVNGRLTWPTTIPVSITVPTPRVSSKKSPVHPPATKSPPPNDDCPDCDAALGSGRTKDRPTSGVAVGTLQYEGRCKDGYIYRLINENGVGLPSHLVSNDGEVWNVGGLAPGQSMVIHTTSLLSQATFMNL